LLVSDLDGRWRVRRIDGLLPPMFGVRKRIRGDRGETAAGPLPGLPFRVERSGDRAFLIYSPPLSMFVDELRLETGGSWLGRTTLGGHELGRFRMTRGWYMETKTKEARDVNGDENLRAKLIDYVQNAHAMEQNVLLMLDSLILTTKDQELVKMFRAHKEETRRQEQRLRERRKALGGLGLVSAGKDLTAIAAAQAKGLADLWRSDKPVQNARDAFATEHLEIAAYEILERLAERAGDAETARIASENRAEEEAMAGRIAENWDRFLDLALDERGVRAEER
jgi:ferritin-like metal-binding protein YciE